MSLLSVAMCKATQEGFACICKAHQGRNPKGNLQMGRGPGCSSRMVRIMQGCSLPCVLGAKMVQQVLSPHSIYTSWKLKQLCKLPGSVQCSLSWNAIFRENSLFRQVGRSRGKAGSTESMSYCFTPSQWLTRRGPLRCTPTVIQENDFRTSLMLAPYPPSKTGEPKDFIDKRGFIFLLLF